jgi:hypothetical protein
MRRMGPDASPSRAPTSRVAVAGVLVLVVADLMPVVGVLFLGWEVFPIVLLYWLENVVVGVVTVLKMTYAEGDDAAAPAGALDAAAASPSATQQGAPRGPVARLRGDPARARAVGFFCFHYGLFTLVHGVFVIVIFGFGVLLPAQGSAGAGAGSVLSWWFLLAFLGLCASHGVSFWRNYLLDGEYMTVTVEQAMFQPYGRVVVMHLTVIFGALLVTWLGTPLAGLLLLVALKTGFDVAAHRREHRRARTGGRPHPAT